MRRQVLGSPCSVDGTRRPRLRQGCAVQATHLGFIHHAAVVQLLNEVGLLPEDGHGGPACHSKNARRCSIPAKKTFAITPHTTCTYMPSLSYISNACHSLSKWQIGSNIHAFKMPCDRKFRMPSAAVATVALVSCEVAASTHQTRRGKLRTGVAGHLYDWMAWKRSGASISRSIMKRHTRLLSPATSPWWHSPYNSAKQIT